MSVDGYKVPRNSIFLEAFQLGGNYSVKNSDDECKNEMLLYNYFINWEKRFFLKSFSTANDTQLIIRGNKLNPIDYQHVIKYYIKWTNESLLYSIEFFDDEEKKEIIKHYYYVKKENNGIKFHIFTEFYKSSLKSKYNNYSWLPKADISIFLKEGKKNCYKFSAKGKECKLCTK